MTYSNTKVFLEIGDYKITSDSRDIMLDESITKDVQEWCKEYNIKYDLNGVMSVNFFIKYHNFRLWRIRDDRQRTMFILRWGYGIDKT